MAGMRFLISKICQIFAVIGFLFFQANYVVAASPDDLYFQAQKSYYKLMASDEKQKFRHHWMKTIKMFSKVIDRYPKSNEAYKAEYTTGKLFEGLNAVSKSSKDLDQAMHHYSNVSTNYSFANLTDDALYRVAEIYLARRNFVLASEKYKEVSTKYPEGDQVKKAREKYKSIKVATKKRYANLTSVTRAKISTSKASNSKTDKKLVIAKPLIKSVKKVARETVKKTPLYRKHAKIKDGLGRGYLFTPRGSRDSQIDSPLIVVDAGHGGKDHGAKSVSGIKEKDVNIKIAKHVKAILVNRYKYSVVMTRKDDTFISLKDRSKISNKRNADLFVSIHANAAKRKSAHGIETYFLGTSHNKQALETAARENRGLVKSVKDDRVQQILASLITTTKINDSSRLASRVQENLCRSSKKVNRNLKNLGVKEGPFYVLHGADMPSILVEVGFLTNQKEAKMLSQPQYIYRLASSIAEGIHKYLQDKGSSI